jgi:hypothetical protein
MAERHVYRDAVTGALLPVPTDFRGKLTPRYRRVDGRMEGDWPQPGHTQNQEQK